MRFSVKKTALATLSSAANGGSKGEGWEIDPQEDPSAVGAVPNLDWMCDLSVTPSIGQRAMVG
jgi:hypothetical protein